MKRRSVVIAVVLATLSCGVVFARRQASSAAPQPLASFVPPGALLAIESPDFSSLLHTWTNSQEEKTWVAGADYQGFSRSRLFGRLGDAQSEFAAAAGLPPDARFLEQIAGKQSLLAWYDIGNLEVLYITRMAPGAAANTPLLQLRDKFEERKAGDASFYVRTQSAVSNDADQPSVTQQTRTVAFAVRGDYLLLATREDLLANALASMQTPADRTLLNEPWYANTVTAADRPAGDLRMTLNLAKIVRDPRFRTYWIQQNITEFKQYKAALSDLYRTPTAFREERVLLAADNATALQTSSPTDLAPVLDYLPANTGVYRAQAAPSVDSIVIQLEDKLLSRKAASYRDPHIAPVAAMSTPTAGDSTAFEQRTDEPLAEEHPQSSSLNRLRALLAATPPVGMLTFSTATQNGTPNDAVFRPIHTAVVLLSATAWNAAELQSSLSAALGPRLSLRETGLMWGAQHNATASWFVLKGMQPLALAVQGNVCVLASDEGTLLQLLAASQASTHTPRPATLVAGFDHHAERAPYLRLAALLDNTTPKPQAADADETGPPANDAQGNGPDKAPAFFSGNMKALSDTFQPFDSEVLTETVTPGPVVHQTVVYQLHPKP